MQCPVERKMMQIVLVSFGIVWKENKWEKKNSWKSYLALLSKRLSGTISSAVAKTHLHDILQTSNSTQSSGDFAAVDPL